MKRTTKNANSIFRKDIPKCGLMIGINYLDNINSKLNGCINDAENLKHMLINQCGYNDKNITFLTDDQPSNLPTKENIMTEIDNLVSKTHTEGFKEVWFSYSGHGYHVNDNSGDEKDGQDEVICPLDYERNGFIKDDYIFENLVKKLPSDVTLIALMDCCHSGTILDLPFVFKNDVYQIDNNINMDNLCRTVMISGCTDVQTSADAYIDKQYKGAMSWSFMKSLQDTEYNITTKDLLRRMREVLKNDGYDQIPMLSSSKYDTLDCQYMTSQVSVTTNPEPTVVNVTFKTEIDYWYSEALWNIWSIKDNNWVLAVDQSFNGPYEKYKVTIPLNKGEYYLVMSDNYGDGGQHMVVSDRFGKMFEQYVDTSYKQVLFNVE
jgi:hypothetical protein